MKKRTRNPTGLMIHCSDSMFGDVELIRKWHTDPKPKGRGWDEIGYNWVILNGCRTKNNYNLDDDGVLEIGRDATYIGVHAKGYNESHLSICLIGEHHFSWQQIITLFKTIKLIRDSNLIENFTEVTRDISFIIMGHCEVNKNKTCPNIYMESLVDILQLYLQSGQCNGFAM